MGLRSFGNSLSPSEWSVPGASLPRHCPLLVAAVVAATFLALVGVILFNPNFLKTYLALWVNLSYFCPPTRARTNGWSWSSICCGRIDRMYKFTLSTLTVVRTHLQHPATDVLCSLTITTVNNTPSVLPHSCYPTRPWSCSRPRSVGVKVRKSTHL